MRVVVLASGGVDSGVLLARAVQDHDLVGVVWCNYGQPAALHEWRALQAQRAHLRFAAPVHEVPLTTVSAASMQAPSGAEGPRVVPHRNLLMLAHALNWAETLGADVVWYGAVRDDWDDYADCRPRFVIDLNHAMGAVGNGHPEPSPHVRVEAPLMHIAKSTVLAEAADLGVLDLSWSCYAPDRGAPCGACNSCAARAGQAARGQR